MHLITEFSKNDEKYSKKCAKNLYVTKCILISFNLLNILNFQNVIKKVKLKNVFLYLNQELFSSRKKNLRYKLYEIS